jgi:hypothetical protein
VVCQLPSAQFAENIQLFASLCLQHGSHVADLNCEVHVHVTHTCSCCLDSVLLLCSAFFFCQLGTVGRGEHTARCTLGDLVVLPPQSETIGPSTANALGVLVPKSKANQDGNFDCREALRAVDLTVCATHFTAVQLIFKLEDIRLSFDDLVNNKLIDQLLFPGVVCSLMATCCHHSMPLHAH